MEILKENKKIFIIAGIVFIVLFMIVFILYLFGNKTTNLVLKCTKDVSENGTMIKHTISIYDYSDYKNVEVDSFFSLTENQNGYYDEYSSLIYKELNSRMINTFGENYTDVTISLEKKSNGFNIIQNISINANNNAKMFEILEYDLWNTSIIDFRDTLERGGFVCK